MIRKILFFILALFVSFWFSSVHLIKNRIIDILNNLNSDNFVIKYDDIQISGFPVNWCIRIVNPNIVLINHLVLRELVLEYLDVVLDYKLDSAIVNIGKTLKYQHSSQSQNFERNIYASDDIKIFARFVKNLYFFTFNKCDTCSIYHIFDLLHIDVHKFSISDIDIGKYVFFVKKFQFLFSRKYNDEFSAKLGFHYRSNIESSKIQKAAFLLDTDYKTRSISNASNITNANDEDVIINYDNLLKINESYLSLNENRLILNGILYFNKNNKFPFGDISVSIYGYHNIMDNIPTNSFLLPKQQLKQMLDKAISLELGEYPVSNNTKFSIIFSGDTIKIGR